MAGTAVSLRAQRKPFSNVFVSFFALMAVAAPKAAYAAYVLAAGWLLLLTSIWFISFHTMAACTVFCFKDMPCLEATKHMPAGLAVGSMPLSPMQRGSQQQQQHVLESEAGTDEETGTWGLGYAADGLELQPQEVHTTEEVEELLSMDG